MKRWLVAGIGLCTAVSLSIGQFWQAQAQPQFGFQGRFLAVLSDADMEASAYIDGQLGDRTPEMTDTLTLIPLGSESRTSPVTLPVSNSVMAWPNNLLLYLIITIQHAQVERLISGS